MNKIPIYFVPGLAASVEIYDYLNLPEDRYECIFLEWLIPTSKKESIEHYAKRLCEQITHENPVLVGVSFGGIMVQEMSKIISVRKVIIISSIKSSREFPLKLKLIRGLKLYKLLAPRAFQDLEKISSKYFGKKAQKRIGHYKKFLSVRDPRYIEWAIHTVLHWKQKERLSIVSHIHGEEDFIFPIKYINDCIVIKGGTHAMIIEKHKKIRKVLISLLESEENKHY
ncbi:alpha/beta fold hydrolase [Aureivirga marina]|uniref:alpha/beta fold hydrolase n=1 Tax=Aureivirga marina TaxID=1182451 RepID=UPI0018CAB704|nr:alpha/beta hydrolase [Aureivirga marina]